jgi:hypothetical protein
MLFSEQFRLTRVAEDDWFDPVLSIDTRLFLDPFLLYADEQDEFEGSHNEIIQFFEVTFKLIAQSHGERTSQRFQKALADLVFPEVEELCLGYTKEGTSGLGSAAEMARLIAGGLWEAIEAGLEEITHFEEIGIFREKIGADRISDITAGLLRWRLAAYTAKVCERHSVRTHSYHYTRGRFDLARGLWIPLHARLPRNQFTGKAVLLVPRRYLRALPTINADDFWDYCCAQDNDTIRNEFGHDIASKVRKHDIVSLARRHPDFVRMYISEVEQGAAIPYNFDEDRNGLVGWYKPTKDYCAQNPVVLENSARHALVAFVDELVNKFQRFVEHDEGWRLLWNRDRSSKGQEAARYLLLGIVKHYCHANGIKISSEEAIGNKGLERNKHYDLPCDPADSGLMV